MWDPPTPANRERDVELPEMSNARWSTAVCGQMSSERDNSITSVKDPENMQMG